MTLAGYVPDVRLEKRGGAILQQMTERQTAIIQQFTDSRAQVVGASRFFNNDRVSIDDLKAAHRAACRARCEAGPGRHVLAIQDTTEINVESNRGRLHDGESETPDSHLGPVGNNTDAGFFLHPTLALDAESGLPLGYADVQIWNRRWEKTDKYARNYPRQPIEEKESGRWIRASEAAKQTLSAADRVTIIADREGDIYTELATVPDERTDVLIRSQSNRRIVPIDGEAGAAEAGAAEAGATETGTDAPQARTLYEAIDQQPVRTTYTLEVAGTNGRTPRTAQMEVRYTAVTICKPRSNHQAASLPETVSLWAVEAREQDGPGGTVPEDETPIRWRLLTSRPIESPAAAHAALGDYAKRPRIEQVFRLLKSEGLRVPRSQLTRGAALKRLTLLALAVAGTLMQLVEGRSGAAGKAPLEGVFTADAIRYMEYRLPKLEGRTAKQTCPHPKQTLAWGSWVVGRLGGWKGYQTADPPGPITMRRGLERLHQELTGWLLAPSR
jgi:hypothetical protein